MPLMNGLEETRIPKKLVPAVPIIIYTAHSALMVEKDGLEAGASAVISKSDDLAVLIGKARIAARLLRFLKSRKQSRRHCPGQAPVCLTVTNTFKPFSLRKATAFLRLLHGRPAQQVEPQHRVVQHRDCLMVTLDNDFAAYHRGLIDANRQLARSVFSRVIGGSIKCRWRRAIQSKSNRPWGEVAASGSGAT